MSPKIEIIEVRATHTPQARRLKPTRPRIFEGYLQINTATVLPEPLRVTASPVLVEKKPKEIDYATFFSTLSTERFPVSKLTEKEIDSCLGAVPFANLKKEVLKSYVDLLKKGILPSFNFGRKVTQELIEGLNENLKSKKITPIVYFNNVNPIIQKIYKAYKNNELTFQSLTPNEQLYLLAIDVREKGAINEEILIEDLFKIDPDFYKTFVVFQADLIRHCEEKERKDKIDIAKQWNPEEKDISYFREVLLLSRDLSQMPDSEIYIKSLQELLFRGDDDEIRQIKFERLLEKLTISKDDLKIVKAYWQAQIDERNLKPVKISHIATCLKLNDASNGATEKILFTLEYLNQAFSEKLGSLVQEDLFKLRIERKETKIEIGDSGKAAKQKKIIEIRCPLLDELGIKNYRSLLGVMREYLSSSKLTKIRDHGPVHAFFIDHRVHVAIKFEDGSKPKSMMIRTASLAHILKDFAKQGCSTEDKIVKAS